MDVSFPRVTLKKPARLEGRGLHSGVPVTLALEPSDGGIVFTCGQETVVASPENVGNTSRCTRLGPVATVEHVMAALAAKGVTDVRVSLSAPELPALDGAAKVYCRAIDEAGRETVGEATVGLFERVFFVEGEVRIGVSKGEGHWRYEFDAGLRWPGLQVFECRLTEEVFDRELAAARTFAFEEEVGPLRAAGLAQGLDLESALVLGHDGYMNPPRWPEEPARHKMLDLVGDLYLSGVPPTALNVVAVRSGHRTNVEAARRMASHFVVSRR